MLNATLDTAEFGDESRWTESPTSGCIRDGWMYGRGCGALPARVLPTVTTVFRYPVGLQPPEVLSDGGYVYLPWDLVRAYTLEGMAMALLD